MKRLGIALFSALSLVVAGSAAAQDKYPSKPVRIIVPYAPGGATDIVARIIGEQMRQILGQPFVVENKPGANGIVAINELVN
jgi:tripartite-type tricarboxylate transporter receptor subunit TctC